MSTLSLTTLRRHAAGRGYRLWKVPDGSALNWDYGPYTLTSTASNEVTLRGVGLDDLADFLVDEERGHGARDQTRRCRGAA